MTTTETPNVFRSDDDDDDELTTLNNNIDNNNNEHEHSFRRKVMNRNNNEAIGTINKQNRRDFLSKLFSIITTSTLTIDNNNNNAYAIENGLISSAWESFGGGGPSDLTFPETFIGEWVVNATLQSVQLPEGAEVVSNLESIERAKKDIGKPTSYPLRFIKNSRNDVILDRAYNTEKLAEYTMNVKNGSVFTDIDWNYDDPNIMKCSLANGKSIFFKVTARSETTIDDDVSAKRFETSEVAEVVFNDAVGADPTVKRTRTYTKWLYRSEKDAQPGQPLIVCTQTVLDYLTPFAGDDAFIKVAGRPVTQYNYKLAMYPKNRIIV